jgi:putative acetyltransferase
VGDPAYYRRFGFGTAADLGIRNTQGIPDEYVMACELVPGALDGVEAAITFST